MEKLQLTTNQDTQQLANDIAHFCQSGDVIILTGDLGAGKTTFTKGFASGLGIEQMIKSPTYTLIREYDTGRLPLYHMDVYRLTEGASDLGLEDYFEGDGICVVEWGQLIKNEIDVPFLEFFLDKVSDTVRDFRIEASSETIEDYRQQLLAYLTEKGWIFKHD
ncbi:tRNA (adenosine(37)-N6)-threonylcarbamoyltransferase complex ATPase subunit type 1 TsaE [Vagococcus penaei]|uniref:tRNA threonylcarbamoyladenosine biosynthesis protein TsaE n=1 Tax=Vagococcus penaei TaxID=633807 RepID=A0A1Q2D5Q1_9ENTE|nr:tRNA (adenosine(37)-N6)-threonylcarbamoyltransferase complex ATPase subunit type 1 TsaE [Vagococcus penaei]AQP53631.1 tRNA (adenosine(37)-N6)-threonylcarbamoyltransferase complex ATPase subunit type 1 TsaE [Vagococcus penaei]RSU07576.1 tRNA (adenosine(37)-N6)-threonylcarbamoyltransferase complex ATPase subunit type 1 TsaE [Vagococcus penaei]